MSRRKSAQRWKALQEKSESLWAPELKGRLKWNVTFHAKDGCPSARYTLLLDGQIIWDWPNMFYDDPPFGKEVDKWHAGWDHHDIEVGLRFYIDTPLSKLFDPMEEEQTRGAGRYRRTYVHDRDEYRLCDVLRAADRRIGYKRLSWWAFFENPISPARRVLGARFEHRKKPD